MTAAAHALSPNRRKRNLDASPPPRHFHGPQSHSRLSQRLLRWLSPPPPPETKRPAFDMGNFISGLSGLFGGRQPKDNGLGLLKSWYDARSRDLTVATDEETGTAQRLVGRRVKDSRKTALEAVKPPQRQKTEPYYKKALEEARRKDGRLEEIRIDIRLEEQKLAEIPKLDKVAKEDLSELLKPLTEEEENEVRHCFDARGPSSKVLVLHEPSNIEVSKEKFQCLRPRCWLNDEVINLYLELLKEREKREPKSLLAEKMVMTTNLLKGGLAIGSWDMNSLNAIKSLSLCIKMSIGA